MVAVKAAVVVVGGRAFEGEDLAFHESKCEYSAMSFKISYHSLLVTLVLKWRGIMYTFRYMNDWIFKLKWTLFISKQRERILFHFLREYIGKSFWRNGLHILYAANLLNIHIWLLLIAGHASNFKWALSCTKHASSTWITCWGRRLLQGGFIHMSGIWCTVLQFLFLVWLYILVTYMFLSA